MSILSQTNIFKVLSAFNPWWQSGSVRPELSKSYHRLVFGDAMDFLRDDKIRRIVMLTGVRRVGKTTIQYQMISKLLQSGVKPEQILFVSFDHPIFKLSRMDLILDCYKTSVYSGDDYYCFFDEIQYATDWDLWLKSIYDMNPLVKMVVTGSASPVLQNRITESGAGRWTVIHVPTLSFFEYCDLLDLDRPILESDLKPSSLLTCSKVELNHIMMKLSALQRYLNRYLLVGGFPELAMADNDFRAQMVMREDVVDKVLKCDIPSLYRIRNSSELERIFLYLCYSSANIISVEAISKELSGVSRATVNDYLTYMESANLIYRSYPADISRKQVLKPKAKVYIADAAIRNAVLMDDSILTDPEQMGITVETAVYNHAAAFYHRPAARVGYYRNGRNGKEIDIVVSYPGGRILIEVKYRENASITTRDAIFEHADGADAAIVVTRREDDYGLQPSGGVKPILRLPAFAFLYLLGNAAKHCHRGL